ncbi:hypothetical protein BS47DRAFT_1308877, partial [Hydnum rufescens UP504]
SVLILNNCSIHHGPTVKALIEDEAGGQLLFLPPYSPDFNLIEKSFSCIKHGSTITTMMNLTKPVPLVSYSMHVTLQQWMRLIYGLEIQVTPCNVVRMNLSTHYICLNLPY